MSMYKLDVKNKGKYLKANVPKFDIHPDYTEKNDVYVACNPTTGKPRDVDKLEYFTVIPCGKYMYVTIILQLGEKGLLIGRAYQYFQKIKEQLERSMVIEFREHDMFCSEDERIGIRVVKQKEGFVIYEKYKVPPDLEEGRFWQFPCEQRKRMPVDKFAMAVIKLDTERYKRLISPVLLI